MNDAIDKPVRKPKDPSDNHFPEFSHDHENRIQALAKRIYDLEKDSARLERRIALLEDAR